MVRKFEDENENLLAAWTLSFAAESFLELADTSDVNEIAIFALESALAYEMQVAENILLLPHLEDEQSEYDNSGEYLEPSVASLAKELKIHLTTMPLERVLHNRRGVFVPDTNHAELDLDRNNDLLSYLPERRGKLIVQQGVKRRDGGVTFKLVIAEKRIAMLGRFAAEWMLPHEIQNYRISSTFLVGRDSSGQLFLNRLPPAFEFEPIDACEKWIFGMTEGDELVREF